MSVRLIRHFLECDLFGRIEITEPMKFDGSTFTLEQEKGRYGRDVTIGSEEVSLRFENVYAVRTTTPFTLPSGESCSHLTMGLPFILAQRAAKGFESEMLYILEHRGTEFTIGQLDFFSGKTDGLNFWEGKIVQQLERAKIKRDMETNVNVFAEEDLKGNAIEPLDTVDMLLKALPTKQSSTWQYALSSPKNFLLASESSFNFSSTPLTYGIDESLSYIFGAAEPRDFPYIEAVNELTDVQINITNLDLIYIPNPLALGDVRLMVTVYQQGDDDTFASYELAHVFQPSNFGSTYSLNIPVVLRGQRIGIFFRVEGGAVNMIFSSMDVEITAISTSIDSVSKVVKYIGLIEKNVEAINGAAVIAPDFQPESSKYFNVFATNGFLLRGMTQRALNVDLKSRFDNLQFCNHDYQITPDGVFIAHERAFYPNRELGVYDQAPDIEIEYGSNERLAVNLIDLVNSTYANKSQQDSTDQATLNSVHTESQYKMPNDFVENKLKIEIKDVFDPNEIENAKRYAQTTKPETSTKNDEKIFVIDGVPLAEDTQAKPISGNFNQRIDPDDSTKLMILNGASSDSVFTNWELMGIATGAEFIITDGLNAGVYTVFEITPSVITLTGTPAVSGTNIITFTYIYNAVFFTNRTDEGFDVNTGLDTPESFGNLRFTPSHILYDSYEEQLAGICLQHQDGVIRGTKFINNGNVTTQFEGGRVITEKANVDVDTLTYPLITQDTVKTRIQANFDDSVTLYRALEEIHDDGTIGGYITVRKSIGGFDKVFPRRASTLWATETMDLDAEIRYDAPFPDDYLYLSFSSFDAVDFDRTDASLWNSFLTGLGGTAFFTEVQQVGMTIKLAGNLNMVTILIIDVLNLNGLNVTKLINIAHLSFANNTINGNLNFTTNTHLEHLSFYNNNANSLNVSNLASLTLIDGEANNLAAVYTANCTDLQEIRLRSNQLTSIVLTTNPNVTAIEADDNLITSIIGLGSLTSQTFTTLNFGNNLLTLSFIAEILDFFANSTDKPALLALNGTGNADISSDSDAVDDYDALILAGTDVRCNPFD